MKLNLIQKVTLALAVLASSIVTAQALPSNWPPGYPIRVTNANQAKECCKAHIRIALACKGCKTVRPGRDEKGILGWFRADSTHGCSGCGGKITVKGIGEQKGAIGIYKHVCSKCGPNSAYVCTDHKS